MQNITVVLLCAGSANRFETKVKKQWLWVGDEPLWKKVENDFKSYGFENIIIVTRKQDVAYMQKLTDAVVIQGGQTRQQSLSNALENVKTKNVLVSDVARCCFDANMIGRIINTKGFDCVVPYIGVNDTVYIDQKPVQRDLVKLIQTPQYSKTSLLKKALQTQQTFTDDSSAIAAMGGEISFVEGSLQAHKLTKLEDIKKIPCLKPPSDRIMSGTGFDTHAFEVGKKMYLCGVEIESGFGFKAHSDGDVAIHSIIDALLGACQMGDIGELYPDTDEQYAGADSKALLKDVVQRVIECGFEIKNVDITIIAQKPKLKPYKLKMQKSIQDIIKCNFVNIKATTAEKMGFVGRCEGVAVQAVATVGFYRWERD